jgi:hypothetical protein
MNTVKGVGILCHKFYGEYSAVIAMQFADEAMAKDAIKTLGTPWKVGQKSANVLVWSGGRDALEDIKLKFKESYGLKVVPCGMKHCKHQCKNAEIDNLNHSVDYGATFEIDVPIVPTEQMSLI